MEKPNQFPQALNQAWKGEENKELLAYATVDRRKRAFTRRQNTGSKLTLLLTVKWNWTVKWNDLQFATFYPLQREQHLADVLWIVTCALHGSMQGLPAVLSITMGSTAGKTQQ